ncbi:MAG: DNA primase [Nitrososphaerota archaeon]|nr:DNA primase [Nitrososphaerota archaeon]
MVKYLVKLRFDVEGVVEKADLIGAIFGQTEGLFGPEMNLQELQKTWKVGRIEINLQSTSGKTSGEVLIPMSTDVSTCALIAAAVENVDKVGPCSAKFGLLGITDVRADRRKVIVDRAKLIMKDWASKTASEGEESLKDIVDSAKKGRLITYGKENLPAGPAVTSSDTLIVVEGRADILNLLRAGIENTIAVEGTSVPDTVKELARRGKTLYAFLDGDRGGDLILRELMQVAKIERVYRAPRGREVEELTPIEILDTLKAKPESEREAYEPREEREYERREHRPRFERGGRYARRERVERRGPRERAEYRYEERPEPVEQLPPPPPMIPEAAEKVKTDYPSINNTLEARIYDAQWNELTKMPVNELVSKISGTEGAKLLVFDGIVTQRLVDAASKVGIESIVGHRTGEIQNKPEAISIYSFKDLGLE